MSVTITDGAGPTAAQLAAIDGGVYGDGSDGAAVFDGVGAVAGATLVGSTYTLDRDVLYSSVVVSVGVSVRTFSFRLLVLGALTNSGTIHNDGNAAALTVVGAALAAKTLGAAAAGGAAGAFGVGGVGNATAFSLDNSTGAGGVGGAGGVNAGGAGGAHVGLIASLGTARCLPGAALGAAFAATGWTSIQGGSGGGGGGSDGIGTNGGAGGGGGGVMVLCALSVTNTATGVIRCAGGKGGDAGGGAGNGGGGAGGGGGTLYLISRSVTNNGSIAAPGGAGGAPILAGVIGGAGVAGNVLQPAA